MAKLQTPYGLWWPPPAQQPFNQGTGANLNAAGLKLAVGPITAEKAGTITAVAFRVVTLGAAGDIEVRLETAGGASNPTGTLLATDSNGTGTVSATGAKSINLTTPATVAQGDKFWIVLVVPGGSTLNATFFNATFNQQGAQVPITTKYDGVSTWTKQTLPHIISVTWSDGTVSGYPLGLTFGTNNLSFDSGSSPNVYGIEFVAPWTGLIRGFHIRIGNTNEAGADFDVKLYDSAYTLLASLSVDADEFSTVANHNLEMNFATSASVSRGSTYRLVVVPTTANNFSLGQFGFADAASNTAGSGGLIKQVSATSPSAWGDYAIDSTRRVTISVVFSEITLGSPAIIGG